MDGESRKTNWEAITVGNQVRNDEDLNLGGGRSQFIFYKTHQFHLLENFCKITAVIGTGNVKTPTVQ